MRLIKRLRKEIFKIAEQAYRRGYQQGNHFASQGVTQKDCYKYRYRRNINKPWGCPERYVDGKINIRMGVWKSLEEIHETSELEQLLWEIKSALFYAHEGNE